MLMPTFVALQPGGKVPGMSYSERQAGLEEKMEDEDLIKTVALWAVSCFSQFHPDVVVMMGLVAAEE